MLLDHKVFLVQLVDKEQEVIADPLDLQDQVGLMDQKELLEEWDNLVEMALPDYLALLVKTVLMENPGLMGRLVVLESQVQTESQV